MHISQIKGQASPVGQQARFRKALTSHCCFAVFLGLSSVPLVSSGTMAIPNATASNPDDRSGGQVNRKAPPGMAWIPGGTFLMGTNEKESFPNERPAHLVQVEGFWMDEHDVTNAEFSKFVEATGYATTAERKIDWEDLKKEVPPGTPKPDDNALAPGALVFTPTSGQSPSMTCRWWRWVHVHETGFVRIAE
jgi:formylglycine-generating enzyme